MGWLKKNLWVAAGGGIALILLGVASFFLWSKYQLESVVTADLATQTATLERLSKLDPHPGNDKVNNIETAKEQEKKLAAWMEEARGTFVPMNYPTNLDSGQLKLLLDTTLDDLQRTANRAGVKLQPGYAFTFGNLKTQMSYEEKTIGPIAAMLMDISTISRILFRSQVLALDGIRRVPVATQDTPSPTPGASEYWNKKPTTNDLAILVPYEFTFHCFTPELGKVLENLYRSSNCFLVKSLVVDPSPSQLLEKPADGTQDQMMMPQIPMMNMQMMQQMMRYGMGRRYMPQPEQVAPVPTAPRGGLTPMLDEKAFRSILWVEAVRLRDPNEVKASKPARTRAVRPTAPAEGEAPAAPDAAADPSAAPSADPIPPGN